MKQSGQEKRRRKGILVAVIAVAILLAGCRDGTGVETSVPPGGETGTSHGTPAATAASGPVPSQGAVEMPHIHGLGFSPDGRQLIVPAHDGLRIFVEGQWLIPDAPAHDYMGYTPADDGFYSSGHPHSSSGLVNPLGLVKSTDGGTTITQLGFEGESDFHLMGVGYKNHAIYVLNPAPNSALPPGIHYSLDDGQTWQPSALRGLLAQPIQIAVHPTEAKTVALATEGGLFLSTDYGDSFAPVGEAGPVTAATFSLDGETLFFGTSQLFAYALASQTITPVPTPTLAPDDAISYIAINPARPEEMALATYGRDIYIISDGGQSWQPIAEDGKAVQGTGE